MKNNDSNPTQNNGTIRANRMGIKCRNFALNIMTVYKDFADIIFKKLSKFKFIRHISPGKIAYDNVGSQYLFIDAGVIIVLRQIQDFLRNKRNYYCCN